MYRDTSGQDKRENGAGSYISQGLEMSMPRPYWCRPNTPSQRNIPACVPVALKIEIETP
jgi:hypothetical protein